jgi:uncharacterized protein YegP (UPF0339 family)
VKTELFRSKDGWRVRLRARNGRVLMSSEAYSSKSKARQTKLLVDREIRAAAA